MKKLCVLTLLFFIALPILNVFAACDDLKSAMEAAKEAERAAQKEVDSLKNQNRSKWTIAIAKSLGAGKDKNGNPSDLGEKMLDQVDHTAVKNKLKEAEEALTAAKQAYTDAYIAYMLCITSHLTREITGPCGHTYQYLNRDSHAWDYFDCGHKGYICKVGIHYMSYCYDCVSPYYNCEGHTCSSSSGSSSDRTPNCDDCTDGSSSCPNASAH